MATTKLTMRLLFEPPTDERLKRISERAFDHARAAIEIVASVGELGKILGVTLQARHN